MTLTPPKLSYGNGWQYDGDRIAGGIEGDWNETEDGSTGTYAVYLDDYLKLSVSGAAGNKVYYVYNILDLAISPTLYSKIRWRFKCSNANIKAKIVLVDSGGHTQTVLAETNSTVFTVSSTTIDFGDSDTLDHIQLYANGATGDIQYDFIQIYKDDFEFPNIGGGDLNFDPPLRDSLTEIPGRITDITHHLGSPGTIVTCSCDLDLGNWKRSGDYINGEVFLEISHGHNYAANYEAWQWLQTGQGHQLKVTVRAKFRYGQDGHHFVDVTMTEFSLCNKGVELYYERFGLNL